MTFQVINMKFLQILFLIFPLLHADDDIWEQDLTDEMKIGISTTGYQSVDLKCGADAFHVNATVNDDFNGVIYTRGDFFNKTSDCFVSSNVGKQQNGGKLFKLKIPFDNCHTVEDASDEEYVNTLIIQHDLDFIMPGDAAFRLSCSFNPEQKLGMTLLTSAKSKIVLVDADPAVKQVKNSKFESTSYSDHVTFPHKAPKDEL